ncbi:MAG: hypothetical protein SF029_10490 [bacterium]|nr:hypothetical protein [bacterium]
MKNGVLNRVSRLVVMVVLLFALLPAVQAQQEDAPVISPELTTYLDQLEATVVRVRGLEPLFQVERYFPTRDEVAAFIQSSYEEFLTDEIVLRETEFYRAFDFVGDDFDLEQVYINFLSSQVAGYYNTETQQMNTVLLSGEAPGDSLPLLERITYAHEYTHALQDQYFDLDAIQSGAAENEPDLALAILSLIEGDATLAMQEYLLIDAQDNPGEIFSILFDPDLLSGAEIPEGTPEILEAELLMPYQVGLVFVQALVEAGGWETVNNAYEDLPQSTEQIIHPDRYLNRDVPQEVEVVDAIEALEGDGWVTLAERTLGEFYLRRYLVNLLPPSLVNQAATGWGGDRYILYYNENADERAFVLNLAWDTPEDAAEFTDAYRDYAALRTESETPVEDALVPDNASCWVADATAEAICLAETDGGQSISYAPSLADAITLLTAQIN